jgi:recombination protein RecR
MLPKSIQKLIDEFSRLPGIGPKSAQRVAMHLLKSPDFKVKNLGESLLNFKNQVEFCPTCWHLKDHSNCHFCDDETRDRSLICVVEDVLDVVAIEKSGGFKGLYHVLHGCLSPLNNIGSDDLKIRELLIRLDNNESESSKIKELILATNPGIEGEATAMYLQKELSQRELVVTRIARGLPAGADLEYADKDTLFRAMTNRQSY